MQKISVIGVMSGSSMDGIDLAYCEFENNNGDWQYRIIKAETIPYDELWRQRLSQLYKMPSEVLAKTHTFYGRYLGKLINGFIKEHGLTPQLIASHGHTVFHRPEHGFTFQLGSGAALQAETGLPVVSDFRTADVAMGGEGAPLVPVGDQILFNNYDACLNLGGIANISFLRVEPIKAYDICPCNIVLNRVARWLGQPYDKDGLIAAEGELDNDLYEELNSLPFYENDGPKSLGREWINEEFWPVVKSFPDTSEEEKMQTLVQHISTQIAHAINNNAAQKVLVTGGGAFNKTLIDQIRNKSKAEIVVPDNNLVNYKEALIFALLGVLRINNQHNVLNSVTGSKTNHIAGALYGKI